MRHVVLKEIQHIGDKYPDEDSVHHTSETPAGTGALLWSVAVSHHLIAGAVGIAGVGAGGGGPYRAAQQVDEGGDYG